MNVPVNVLPTLADILAQPELSATLPPATLAELYARVARLEADLRALLLTSRATRPDGSESPAGDRLWTIPEVADFLSVPEGHVYELARQGKIPVVRFGKYVRVPGSALKEWVVDHQGGRLDMGVHIAHGGHDGLRGLQDPKAAGSHPDPAGRTDRRNEPQRRSVGTRRVRDSTVGRATAPASGDDGTASKE